MSFAIYKYPINNESYQQINMPKDAKILSVQLQNNMPCIWAMVNLDNPMEIRKFYWFFTGEQMDDPDAYTYIATFQLGWMVCHLFEEK